MFKPSQPKSDETDGSQVSFPLAAVAIKPAAGWRVFRPNLSQKDTDTQICEPTLMSRLGSISTLLFPADGLTVAQQADSFASRSSGSLVERTEMLSTSGIRLVRLVIREKLKKSGAEALSISHFFTNQKDRVAMIYFVGEPDTAIKAGEMMVQTLSYKSDGD